MLDQISNDQLEAISDFNIYITRVGREIMVVGWPLVLIYKPPILSGLQYMY